MNALISSTNLSCFALHYKISPPPLFRIICNTWRVTSYAFWDGDKDSNQNGKRRLKRQGLTGKSDLEEIANTLATQGDIFKFRLADYSVKKFHVHLP